MREGVDMKKIQLRLWHPIAGFLFVKMLEIVNNNLFTGTKSWFLFYELIDWTSGICLLLLLYIVIRNIVQAVKDLIARRSSGEAGELERQREIERKEIDIVRKSNEILLHLIQDEHREEGDR